ncbi:MAG TPA: hypothetical protein VK783_03515 [Bacteroidia bacterium]|jgi:hypothetical protein|nr:hypothetical protein [Bacteroidia bacterium]
MDKQNEQLEALTEIRSMMERSSRFISLSGLSGVSAGICALIGAAVAFYHFHTGSQRYYEYATLKNGAANMDFYIFCFTTGSCVLLASLAAGIFFTVRKAKRKGQGIWDATAKRVLINLFIPLAAGGLFCLSLLYNNVLGLIAPATLIFYGLALINASKYTLNDIRYLGICEIVIGLIASCFMEYGIFFWAIGFGVMHIIYGTVMYFKYEKPN